MASYTTYTVQTEAQLKVLAHSVRGKILRLMRRAGTPMTVQMIAEELGEKHGNTYYHVKKLIDADFIELVKTETVNGIIAKYYLRKYDLIYISPDVKYKVASENPTQFREYRDTTYQTICAEFLEQIHPHDFPIDSEDSFANDYLGRGYYNFDPDDIRDIAREIREVCEKYNDRTLNTERYVRLTGIGKQRKDIFKPIDQVKEDALK